MNTKDDRRGGFYWLDGTPFVSVTNVLKVIDKPQLRYWFGKEVYLAMVKNPALGEQEALSAPYKKSDDAKSRGTTVHSIVEAWKNTQTQIETIPDEFKGYSDAFYQWVRDADVKLIAHEKTVVSRQHGYAGTLDLMVENRQGDVWIIDVKTGKDIYAEAFIQVSAYQHALKEDEGIDVKRMGILLLGENGKYKFQECEDQFPVFLACKSIWSFLNAEMCEKVGYKSSQI